MKVFKYKFTRLTTALIYAGLALCIIGLGINIYTIILDDVLTAANPVYPVIKHVLMFLIPVVLFVILLSLLLSSYYSIDGTILKTSFGIIKSKYNICDIENVLLDRTTNKLSVYFKNNSFIVIVVKEDWYDDFIDALLKANTEIQFSINSKEVDGNDDKDKK